MHNLVYVVGKVVSIVPIDNMRTKISVHVHRDKASPTDIVPIIVYQSLETLSNYINVYNYVHVKGRVGMFNDNLSVITNAVMWLSNGDGGEKNG